MLRLLRVALFLGCCAFGAQAAESPATTIRLRGSDSMDPLLRLWAAEFQKRRPEILLDILSHGSGTAPAALLSREADLGHMSRPMNSQEQDAFLARFGYAPTAVTVAFDALAIFVHKDNPLKRLTTDQLDAIYSLTRKSGWEEPISQWGDLFLRKPLRGMDIHPWSRDEMSGTRAFFNERVMGKEGVMRGTVRIADQLGILDAVTRDPAALGYGPLTYATPLVRMVPLAGPRGGRALLPTPETIQSGQYPLARALSVYVNKAPGNPLPEPTAAFLTFILSPEGQELVQRYGSVPLPAEARTAEASRIH